MRRRSGPAVHLSSGPVACSPTNVLPTAVTVLRVAGLVAGTAVGAALTHDVALPSQRDFALEAAEVTHVPVPALGLGALRGEDDLQGGGGGDTHGPLRPSEGPAPGPAHPPLPPRGGGREARTSSQAWQRGRRRSAWWRPQ